MSRVLVERAMAGDHEAFSELTRLSIAKLYAIAAPPFLGRRSCPEQARGPSTGGFTGLHAHPDADVTCHMARGPLDRGDRRSTDGRNTPALRPPGFRHGPDH